MILALARGRTIRSAARVAGFSERQTHRKLGDPAFRGRVSKVRGAIVGRAVGILSAAGAEAARTLQKLLASQTDQVRLAAARSILELGTKLRETMELTERIEALEWQLQKQRSGQSGNDYAIGGGNRGTG